MISEYELVENVGLLILLDTFRLSQINWQMNSLESHRNPELSVSFFVLVS